MATNEAFPAACQWGWYEWLTHGSIKSRLFALAVFRLDFFSSFQRTLILDTLLTHLHTSQPSLPRLPSSFSSHVVGMGVRGLARLIKETEGTLAHDLKSTVVHLDILSVYFSLINTRCYNVALRKAAKDARDARPAGVLSPLSEYTATAPASRKRRPVRHEQPTSPAVKRTRTVPVLIGDINKHLKRAPRKKAFFLGDDGRITTTPPLKTNPLV